MGVWMEVRYREELLISGSAIYSSTTNTISWAVKTATRHAFTTGFLYIKFL